MTALSARAALAALALAVAPGLPAAAQDPGGVGPQAGDLADALDNPWYMSTELEALRTDDGDTATWLSFTLSREISPRLSFGVELGRSLEGGTTDALAFVTYSPTLGSLDYLAVTFGAGREDQATAIKLGLSAERTLPGSWWVGVDASSHYWPDTTDSSWSTTLSTGYRPETGLGGVARLEAGRYPGGDPLAQFIPGVTWSSGSFKAEADAVVPLNDAALPGVKLSVELGF